MPTKFTATVVWLGVVADSTVTLRGRPVHKMDFTFAGDSREFHSGVTAKSDVRVLHQWDRGTEIVNVRQLSILSEEELSSIATEMGVEKIDPASVGASMVVRGIPNFTHIPPSSRLQVNGKGGTTFVIDMENRPCMYPGLEIEKDYPGRGNKWKVAAAFKRGVTAWVQSEGPVSVGDTVTLHVPDQPEWMHLEEVLSETAISARHGRNGGSAQVSRGLLGVIWCFLAVIVACFYIS